MEEIIKKKLLEIEETENVKILHAIESGSRAWGFASPNSDFDVRFIYVRKAKDYLTLRKTRDVIELPIDGDLDINGWDITKAISLFAQGNCALIEWLNSPIVYMGGESKAIEAIRQKSHEYFRGKAAIYHHHHLASGNWERYLLDKDKVVAKKYLYVVRSLLACLWVSVHQTNAPVAVSDVLTGLDNLDAEFLAEFGNLIALKRKIEEKKVIDRIAVLDAWIKKHLMIFDPRSYTRTAPDFLEKGQFTDDEKDEIWRLAREEDFK